MGLSRQEHWSGLPFPSPMHESEKWKWKWSRVRLLVTLWTAAYQAPPPMGFSRQEYWSGLPLPEFLVIQVLKFLSIWLCVCVSCSVNPILCNPMDFSPPCSSTHGIFQARVLEWIAFSFSRRSSGPRDWAQVSCTAGRFFTHWATREALMAQLIKNLPAMWET